MKKTVVLVAAFFLVCVAGVATAGSASAIKWLKGGEPLTKTESTAIHGTLLLVHKGGTLGAAKLECSILLIGTVAPEIKGSQTLVESATGEKDLVKCKTIEGFCGEPIVHFASLVEWELILIGGVIPWFRIYNRIVWIPLCSFGITVECEAGEVKAKFEGNGTSGAKFAFKGAESGEAKCSDGGTLIVESPTVMEMLGITVS